jgi:hypothetical protein
MMDLVRSGTIGLCATLAFLALGPSGLAAAQGTPTESGSTTLGQSTVYAPAGTGSVDVMWSASCSSSRFWYVNTDALHADGSHANHISTAESDGTTSDSRTHSFILTMAPGLQRETFQVTTKLTCDPNPETIIGQHDVTLTRCDPDAFNRSEREFDLALQHDKLGKDELKESKNGLKTFAKDYAEESARVTAEKSLFLDELKVWVAETPIVIVKVAAVAAGAIFTAQEVYLVWQDYKRLQHEAKDDFDLAQREAKMADADLKAALASRTCLEPAEGQLDRMLKKQKREDDARAIIGSWENNGYQYVSPITHEVVDEATALKQARAALEGGSAKGSSTARAARAPRTATGAQVRRALRHVNRAIRISHAVGKNLARVEAASSRAVTRLTAVLS